MILAVSRFRVTNGREGAVRDAFFNRPHFVDKVAGFLGMEVFTAATDPAYFCLLTRWTDIDSYENWHSSDAHRLSHKGIPRGLKLDRTATEVTILHRLNDSARQPDLADFAADAAPLLTQHLATTQATCLFLVAPDGKIRTCNGAAAAVVKISADRLVGESLWRFLPETEGLALRQRIQQAPRDLTERFFINVIDLHSSPATLECYLDVQPDGFVLLGEAPRKQDDAFQQAMIRLNNDLAVVTRENARKSRALEMALTELKEAQARLVHQEKMASLGLLTAGIAHEINNPISFVLNNQSTLERDFEDLLELINVVGDSLKELTIACPAVADQIRQKAEAIELSYLAVAVPKKIADNLEGLARVRKIVLDLRNFSRLDEGEIKPCDAAEGIQAGLKFLSPVFNERGITLETHFPPLPPLICAPGPLNQAVSNVIVNAVRASQPGQTVTVSTAHENGYYVISVHDEGSGIATEHLTKLFDPFFTTKPVGAGTGLGLSIAHQVIQAHCGNIQVASELGKGTTMRLCIPLEQGAADNSSNNPIGRTVHDAKAQ